MAMAAVEFAEPASESQLEALAEKLRARNFEVVIVNDGAEAKAEVLKRIPEGAQVHSGKSKTLEDAGLFKEFMGNEKYDFVRRRTMKMDQKTQRDDIRRAGAASRGLQGVAAERAKPDRQEASGVASPGSHLASCQAPFFSSSLRRDWRSSDTSPSARWSPKVSWRMTRKVSSASASTARPRSVSWTRTILRFSRGVSRTMRPSFSSRSAMRVVPLGLPTS